MDSTNEVEDKYQNDSFLSVVRRGGHTRWLPHFSNSSPQIHATQAVMLKHKKYIYNFYVLRTYKTNMIIISNLWFIFKQEEVSVISRKT